MGIFHRVRYIGNIRVNDLYLFPEFMHLYQTGSKILFMKNILVYKILPVFYKKYRFKLEPFNVLDIKNPNVIVLSHNFPHEKTRF